MTHFVGLDVSLRSVAVCIIDDNGDVKLEMKAVSEVEELVRCLRTFDGEIERVGLEAGTLTQYLTHGLQTSGFETVRMEARQVSTALSAMRNKTDKNDARGIAQVLRSGWYSVVHVKSVESHHTRALLSSRDAVLRKCIDLENEVRGLLKVFGVKLPSPLNHGPWDKWVRKLVVTDEALTYALLPVLDARLELYRSYLELDRRVKDTASDDGVCQRLMSVPGVGPVTALTFKAAVDEPTRFKGSRTVGAHFGLTPRRFQSGEKDGTGRISKAGDARVRAVLYAAATSLLTRTKEWSSLKAWGMRLSKIRGHRRAVVAMARKLAVILHQMWCDSTDFRWHSQDRLV